MASLGNVLEPEPGDADKRRGPDIRADIEVPSSALGAPAGYAAPLPHKVPYAGERIERSVVPGEEHLLRLHLPETLPPGAVLRLRRQGGVCKSGVPGDLYAKIVVSETALAAPEGQALAPSTQKKTLVIVAAVVLGAVIALLLL